MPRAHARRGRPLAAACDAAAGRPWPRLACPSFRSTHFPRISASLFTSSGVDYDKSFSSTMRATTFRALMAIAATRNLRAEHIDVSNAFCQAELDGVSIWVEPPRGFGGLCGKGFGLRLLKALYGTKQASRLWQQTLAEWLLSKGFRRLKTDPCVFIKTVKGRPIIVGCYVDDLCVLHDPRI